MSILDVLTSGLVWYLAGPDIDIHDLVIFSRFVDVFYLFTYL